MKKPSENVTRILSWALSGGILASSCSPVQETQRVVQMENKGKSAIPITLSEHERKYIDYLSGIASKMIKDPAFAREFSQAPEMYLVTRSGSDVESSPIDDDLLKVTTALGDEDMRDAIDDAVSAFATVAADKEKILDVEKLLKSINLNVFKDIERKSKEEML